MEELGLVLREAMFEDHRCAWVELTDPGRRSVRRAARLFIHTGRVQLAVDSALCPDRWHNETACLHASAACDRTLRRLRHAYRDLATLRYPLVPDYVPPDPKQVWAALMSRP